jgi:carbonic anhydrase/acetyltransferase-like protein (isoleucine patch superfamily)
MLRAYRGQLPIVHPTAYIDASAQVIGDVAIGAESGVWMNVVVRGDVNRIRIGDRSNLQDGVVVHGMLNLHEVTIGDEVTIGHGALVHGCAIADRVLVGMGAIVMNGASIGPDSIVAAGALVTEGSSTPPRSLIIGSPAKVRRELTDDEVASVREYAARYVRYRLDYIHSMSDDR